MRMKPATPPRKRLPRPGSTVLVGTVPIRRLASPLARRFNQICVGAMAEALGDDVTPLQYATMAYLRDEPLIDQTSLAARLAIDRTNAGLQIDQLERRGFVKRSADPNDRRVRQVSLTPRGAAFHASLSQPLLVVQRGILDAALEHKEVEILLDLLVRVVQANERHARPGNGRRKSVRRITVTGKAKPST